MSIGKRERNKQLWLGRIQEWDQSKLTQESYCQQHGISTATFAYWLVKYRKENSPSSAPFIPVRTSLPTSITNESIQITLTSGMRVHIPCSIPPEIIAKLIHILGNPHD